MDKSIVSVDVSPEHLENRKEAVKETKGAQGVKYRTVKRVCLSPLSSLARDFPPLG